MLRLTAAALVASVALSACGIGNNVLKNQHYYSPDVSDQSEMIEVATLASPVETTIDYNSAYTLSITAPAGQYVFKGKDFRGGKYFEARIPQSIWLTYKTKLLGTGRDKEYVIGGVYVAQDGSTEVYWHWFDATDGAVRASAPGMRLSFSREVDPGRLRAKQDRDERARLEETRRQQEEEARQRAEAARKLGEQRKAEMRATLAEVRRRDRVQCTGVAQCDRTFALAQAYLLKQADMRIQVATPTLIETYNATEDGRLQLRLVRVPTAGDQWEVVISAGCRDENNRFEMVCLAKLIDTYSGFLPHMRQQ